MNTILVIEDDTEINRLTCSYLIENGYNTHSAFNGLQALEMWRSIKPDLILLDLMLPFHSGDEILKEIRKTSNIPVIVLSAKDMVQTKVDLLRLGADDYMTKPFDLNELIARIETNLKRFHPNTTSNNMNLSYGSLSIHIDSKEVFVDHQLITLTAKEYLILELLLENPQKIYSKQNLYESIWNEPYAYDNDTINTHMSNLRKKIKEYVKDDYIETVWGIGYRLKKI